MKTTNAILGSVIMLLALSWSPTVRAQQYQFERMWGSLGTATNQFNSPNGVAVDAGSGLLFVADTTNHRIGVFTPDGTFVRSWGTNGTTAGRFNTPSGVAVDSVSGRVYVADTTNHRIQTFNADGLFLRTWGSGGTGTNNFSSPRGVAVDPTTGLVYIADTSNHRIRVFTSEGTFVRGWGSSGTGTNNFSSPRGVAIDPATGLVYVADTANHRVRVFTSTGTFVRGWGSLGTGTNQFNNPSGIAVDPTADRVFVADSSNHRVQVFTSQGVYVQTWGKTPPATGTGSGEFNTPRGVAVDVISGRVYAADTTNHRIQKFRDPTDPPEFWVITAAESATYQGETVTVPITITGGGLPVTFTVTNLAEGVSATFTPDNCTPNPSCTVNVQLSADSLGFYRLIINAQDGVIRELPLSLRVRAPYEFERMWGSQGAGSGQFDRAAGIAVDPGSGFVYVADTYNSRIQVFDPDGKFVSSWGGAGTDFYGGGQMGRFLEPRAVAVDPVRGSVYVLARAEIQVFPADGSHLRAYGWGNTGSGPGQFSQPRGMVIDPTAGLVFVADTDNNRIQVFTTAGQFVRLWGMQSPHGIAFDPTSGLVYVTSYLGHFVSAYGSTGELVRTWGQQGTTPGLFTNPVGIAVDPVTGLVFVADRSHRIQIFTPEGRFLDSWNAGAANAPVSGTGPREFNYPGGIAVDPISGRLYITDTSNYRIQKFRLPNAPPDFWVSTSSSVLGQPGQTMQVSIVLEGASVPVNFSVNNLPAGITATVTPSNCAPAPVCQVQAQIDVSPSVKAGVYQFTIRAESGVIRQFPISVHVSKPYQLGATWTVTGSPFAVAVDSVSRLVYVAQGNNRIQVFTPDGTFVRSFGTFGTGLGQLSNPIALTVHPATGLIYVVDAGNNRIQVFAPDGTFVRSWGSYGTGPGQFTNPDGIAVDPSDGLVYVGRDIDVNPSGPYRVQVFTPEGAFVRGWGEYGYQFGDVPGVEAVAVDPGSGNVYVPNRYVHRVQAHTRVGGFVRAWGGLGSNRGQFSSPRDVEIDLISRLLFVVDSGNHRIQMYTLDGAFLDTWGAGLPDAPTSGSGAGEFNFPRGVTVDASGRVYVADTTNFRIQRFDPVTPDFSMAVSKDELTIIAGRTNTTTITVSRDGASQAPVIFSLVGWLPSDVTATLSADSCVPSTNCTVELKIVASDNAIEKKYGLKVVAVSGNITQKKTLTINILKKQSYKILNPPNTEGWSPRKRRARALVGLSERQPSRSYGFRYTNFTTDHLTNVLVKLDVPQFVRLGSGQMLGFTWPDGNLDQPPVRFVPQGSLVAQPDQVSWKGIVPPFSIVEAPMTVARDPVIPVGWGYSESGGASKPTPAEMAGAEEYFSRKVISSRILSSNEVAQLRADDVRFDELVRFVRGLGYTKASLTKESVRSDGSRFTHQIHIGGARGFRVAEVFKIETGSQAQGFVNPVANGIVTTAIYPVRLDPLTGGLERHAGVDIWRKDADSQQGVPVQAIADGTVVDVGWDEAGYGQWVLLKHVQGSSGLYSLYGHLRSGSPGAHGIEIGKQVLAGDMLGIMGNTGASTGTHLHFETRQYTEGNAPSYEDFLQQALIDPRVRDYVNYPRYVVNEFKANGTFTFHDVMEGESGTFNINVNDESVSVGGRWAGKFSQSPIAGLDTGSVSSGGVWGSIPLSQQTIRHCMETAMIKDLGSAFHGRLMHGLGKHAEAYGWIGRSITCYKAVAGDNVWDGISCLSKLAGEVDKRLKFLDTLVGFVKLVTECANDPKAHPCTKDVGACGHPIADPRGLRTYKCDLETGYLSFTGSERCREECSDGECVGLTPPTPRCPDGSQRDDCFLDLVALETTVSQDPNEKYGPAGDVLPGQRMDYRIECENVGEGTAVEVFITDSLDPNLDETTLVIENGGEYLPESRSIIWEIGELDPAQGAEVRFSVNVRSDAPIGSTILNQATIHFPNSLEGSIDTSRILNTVRTIVAHPQVVETEEGVALPITLTGAEVGGLPLSYQVVEEPMNGELSGTPPNLVYTPGENFEGMDWFAFSVSNGLVDSEPAGVFINVQSSSLDTIPPEVYFTSPDTGEIATDLQPVIRAWFTEPMSPDTINSSTFQVGGVTGTVEYNDMEWMASFKPSAPLAPLTTYMARVTTGVRDSSGNAMAQDYVWQFTTPNDVEIAFNPLSLNYGTVLVGETAGSEAVIRQAGAGSLRVGTINILGPDAGQFVLDVDQCSGRTLPAADMCVIRISFRPTSPGAKTAVLVVPSDDPVTPEVQVPLNGTAVPAVIPDSTPPVLSGCADIVVECAGPGGATASFSVTATDDKDPNPVVTLSHASGSMFPIGVTTVTATATDASGNSSQCSFTVTVQDTTAPVITVLGNNPVTVACGGSYTDAGATAVDVCSGPVAVNVSGAVDTDRTGTYTLAYSASDGHGNTASAVRTVHVVDATAPAISCPADVTAEAAGALTAVTIGQATASDSCDAAPALSNDAPATFPIGVTVVTWTARDASGNSSVCQQQVTVRDTTAPQLSACPDNITVGCQGVEGATVTFTTPTAADVCDAAPVVTMSRASGSVFPIGVTTVTAAATDASGNASQCSFTVTVPAPVLSYLPPIKTGIENVVKVNQTIPVKVQVDCGSLVLANLKPEIRLVQGNYTEANPNVEEEITQVSTSAADTTGEMRWSATDGHYIYNLSTKGLKTTQNYTVIVRLRNAAGTVVSEVRALLLTRK